MKRQIAAATAALVAICLPTLASAADDLKYKDLIHCAATNIVVASVLSLDDGETKNKTEIDSYRTQAAALMVVATLSSNKDSKAVQEDVSKESDGLISVLGDNKQSKAFIETDVPTCNNLGKAAVEVVNEAKAGK